MNNRISKEKRALILSALAEGTAINAVCRMFKAGNHAVLRIIEETGEALGAYMSENFVALNCRRVEMDEQWQYVGKHGVRMEEKEEERGDFWLWAAIDADTKLVITHHVGWRDRDTSRVFISDLASRVNEGVQLASDPFRTYAKHVREFFGNGDTYCYGQEAKTFAQEFNPSEAGRTRKYGIPKIAVAERSAVVGSPDLNTLTTAHIERAFLTVRQELSRFGRLTLAYSKSLKMHKAAIAMHFGIYNLVRKHKGVEGLTPAQAAGIEDRKWTYEDVVELTDRHNRAKEDAAFEAAFAEAHKN
jgi:IS1 family transposase